MKLCPQCNRVEPDETLKFCRIDGATLISHSSSIGSEAGTAQLGSSTSGSEGQTSILRHNTNAGVRRATGPTTTLPIVEPANPTQQLSEGGRQKILVSATAMILVMTLVVIGYFIAAKFIISRKDKG